jgi:hypothetical protein
MDILVDIIVLIIKGLSKPKQPQVPALTPQQAAAQQAAMQQRLQAMQKVMADQQARTRPKQPVRRPIAGKPAAPLRPSLVQQSVSTTAASSRPTVASAKTPSQTRASASGMLVPLILGEILAPPLALREQEV